MFSVEFVLLGSASFGLDPIQSGGQENPTELAGERRYTKVPTSEGRDWFHGLTYNITIVTAL